MRDLRDYLKQNWHLSIHFWEFANLNFAAAGALIALIVSALVANGWEFAWTNFGLWLLAIFSGSFLLTMLIVVTPFRMWALQRRELEEKNRQIQSLLAGPKVDPRALSYVRDQLDRCTLRQLKLLDTVDAVGIPEGTLVSELEPMKVLLEHDGRSGTGYAGLNTKLRDAVRQELDDPLRKKRGIRVALGTFLGDGQSLMGRCGDEQTDPPNSEADLWAAEVERFLSESLDGSYVARFRNGSGLPLAANSIVSLPHRKLWGGLHVRVARLQEFIKEQS